MAISVREIMNSEVYAVTPDTRVDDVRTQLFEFGIRGAPVVDRDGHVLGAVESHDLACAPARQNIAPWVRTPAIVIFLDTSIHAAARLLVETQSPRLIVVDAGKIVGVASSLDLVAGVLGLPAQHPSSFPHFDEETRQVWSDPLVFDYEHLRHVPQLGGALQLIHGGVGMPERLIWSEGTGNLRSRLIEILSSPEEISDTVARLSRSGTLRFRTSEASFGRFGGSPEAAQHQLPSQPERRR